MEAVTVGHFLGLINFADSYQVGRRVQHVQLDVSWCRFDERVTLDLHLNEELFHLENGQCFVCMLAVDFLLFFGLSPVPCFTLLVAVRFHELCQEKLRVIAQVLIEEALW